MRNRVFVVCALLLGVFCGFNIYHYTGIVHTTRKNGFGCICHDFNPSPAVSVWIAGPDSLQAGAEALYTVNVAKDTNIAAGFNVATFFGRLGVFDSLETYWLEDELTHAQAKMGNGRDTISWSFYYTAPNTVGLVDTLYSVGNSVDTSYDPLGDAWNFGPNFLVRSTGVSSVRGNDLTGTHRLLQNYPNPFNPSTVIRYELPEGGTVDLSVFDMGGRLVGRLVDGYRDAGIHEAAFSAEDNSLASGMYMYRISVSSRTSLYTSTRKMLLMK